MHVIKLKALHLRAIDQRRMRRREPPIGAPDRRVARFVEVFERFAKDAAPLQMRSVNCAAERIQNQ
jgi:hypothetical protein